MQRDRSARDYEVYCPRCRVTFPVGAKKCLHCGGRVGPRSDQGAMVGMRDRILEMPDDSLPSVFESEVADEEMPRRSGLRSPITLLWVALALSTAVYRACTGPG